MFQSERKPPPAAVPPSAAATAAGIASAPEGSAPPEALPMPAAPFSEAFGARPTRQFDIDPGQCRWIIADEAAGADALMCGAPAERRRPFCTGHSGCAYLKPSPEEAEAMEEEVDPDEADEEEEESE